jgi:hypothetical protein
VARPQAAKKLSGTRLLGRRRKKGKKKPQQQAAAAAAEGAAGRQGEERGTESRGDSGLRAETHCSSGLAAFVPLGSAGSCGALLLQSASCCYTRGWTVKANPRCGAAEQPLPSWYRASRSLSLMPSVCLCVGLMQAHALFSPPAQLAPLHFTRHARAQSITANFLESSTQEHAGRQDGSTRPSTAKRPAVLSFELRQQPWQPSTNRTRRRNTKSDLATKTRQLADEGQQKLPVPLLLGLLPARPLSLYRSVRLSVDGVAAALIWLFCCACFPLIPAD